MKLEEFQIQSFPKGALLKLGYLYEGNNCASPE